MKLKFGGMTPQEFCEGDLRRAGGAALQRDFKNLPTLDLNMVISVVLAEQH